jgi:hypothetical protein
MLRGENPEVVITIDAEGNASVEGVGFVGTECDAWVTPIAQELGEEVEHQEKPERREQTAVRAEQRVSVRG